MDRRAWRAIVHGVIESKTQLSDEHLVNTEIQPKNSYVQLTE